MGRQRSKPLEDRPGVVSAHEAYALDELQARLRLREDAWRNLRRQGLPVTQIGNRVYVLGSDVIDWLRSQRGGQHK